MTTSATAVLKKIKMVQTEISASGEVSDSTSMSTAAIRKPSVENIDFGGEKHSDRSRQVGDFVWVRGSRYRVSKMNGEARILKRRPESMKSLVCDGAACRECKDTKGCWHGEDYKDGRWPLAGKDGVVKVKVPAGSNGKRFVTELWARCGNGGGYWSITKSGKIKNGIVSVYLNGDLQGTLGTPGARTGLGQEEHLGLTLGLDSHIRIEFTPTNPQQNAIAEVYVNAEGVDPEMDDCMAVKECLKLLGDGSESAFRLRNNNTKQWRCLTASTKAKRKAISKHCAPWEKCLSRETGRKEKLVAVLGAAFRRNKKNAALIISGLSMKEDPNTCVDPSVDDPESWECACIEHMVKECGGTNEECFNNFMCKEGSICCSWKQAHCEASDHCQASLIGQSNASATKVTVNSAALSQRANQNRSALIRTEDQHGTQVTSHVASSHGLDSTVTGKCTSEAE